MIDPLPGETWWVELEPAVGAEANKTRPCIVVGSAAFTRLGLRVIVPLTTWKPHFGGHRNKVRIQQSAENGLDLDSAADAIQIRSVALERFRHRVGALSAEDVEEVSRLLAVVLGLEVAQEQS